MNKFLQRVFVVLAIAFAAFALLLTQSFPVQGIPLMTSKTFFGAIFCSLFFLVAAFRLGKEWKFRIFLVVFVLIALEFALQATGLLGLLPGVNIKLRCPYARAYWTAEGRGNSIRNRLGW